jgi:hypothetical protein
MFGMRSQESPSVSLIHRRLLAGYAVFAPVAWCHDMRDGYAYKYTNDVEIEHAHAAIKANVEQTSKEDASHREALPLHPLRPVGRSTKRREDDSDR